MNRISTSLLLLLALGLSVVSTAACAGDDDDGQNDPPAQASELTDAEKKAAETQETPRPVDTSTTVTELKGPLPDPWDHTGLLKSCDTCGPLPDPWAQTSSSSGATTTGTGTGTTDTSGHK